MKRFKLKGRSIHDYVDQYVREKMAANEDKIRVGLLLARVDVEALLDGTASEVDVAIAQAIVSEVLRESDDRF